MVMEGYGILWSIIIGLAAGAIAGWLMRSSMGIIMSLVIGLIGSVLGGWIYSLLGVSSGGSILGTLLMSVVGAVVLLGIVSLFRRSTKS